MARLIVSLPALLLLAMAGALVSGAAAQRGPPKVHPRSADIPFIQCQVCELLASNAWRQVEEMKAAATPSDKVDEMKIIDRMEKITTAWRPEGEWITSLDLVEQRDRLVVKEMQEVGICGVECKTVERAAEQIMGEHDTDVAEVLFTGKKNHAQFSSWLCHELTGVCRSKPPPLPKGRQPGPAFQPQREGDQNLDRVMGQMQDNGMRGQMWSREELMEKYGMPEGHRSDEDEEEGEEDGSVPTTPPPRGPPVRQAVEHAHSTAQQLVTATWERVRATARSMQGLWDGQAQDALRQAADRARGVWAALRARWPHGRQQQQQQEL